ncbi:MAG: PAS domain-containing protein [Desulfobacteraceae bacterium]|nr:PAS domain-containing protein [Desulfobacteraceae bacterium]
MDSKQTPQDAVTPENLSPSPAQVGRYIIKVPFLRNLLLVCLAVICAYPLTIWFCPTPSLSWIAALCVAATMLVLVVIILLQAGRAMLAHQAMDEALRQDRHNLELSVDQRTADLIQSNKDLQLEISHRKQAEKALQDNLKFMNTLLDTIPNPVFFKDDEGVFLGCNTAYNEIVGLPKDEIIGHRLMELERITFRDRAQRYHDQDMELIQSPGIQIQEQQILSAQGDLHDYMLFKATFRDAEGQVAGLVGIMMDITARKKSERELKESQNLFDAFMRHLPGPAFIKDLQGQYIYINHGFSKLAGKEIAEILGTKEDQLWEAQTTAQLLANDQVVLDSHAATTNTEVIRRPDQPPCHLLTTRFPIFREQALTALGGFAIDITEQTEAEEGRRQLERQLVQAQKMEALGTLAGGIAHDFNNILAGILGYTQIALADVPKGSALQDYLKRVLEASERAGALVKQILTFSRKSDIEPIPVQVKPIIKEVLKLVRSTLPVTIEMVQQIQSDNQVMADPVQIHQVMMNLCANAGYAMRNTKSGTLTVRLEDVTLEEDFTRQYTNLKPGPYLRLSIMDTGQGIAPEHLTRVFDPFFTTKPKGEGTGMGLSVVHGIVASLKGVVLVESTLGHGARFDIYLPALQGQAELPKPKAHALPVGTERILFVDDEIYHTDMLKHMLGLLGYKVKTSNKPEEALALLSQDPKSIDLIITDMVMPGMTGDEFSQKALQIRPDLPIIMCTGYSENISEERALALGIRAFTLKPISMDVLAKLIREVLDKKTPGSTGEEKSA